MTLSLADDDGIENAALQAFTEHMMSVVGLGPAWQTSEVPDDPLSQALARAVGPNRYQVLAAEAEKNKQE